jgi:hypothetical protein
MWFSPNGMLWIRPPMRSSASKRMMLSMPFSRSFAPAAIPAEEMIRFLGYLHCGLWKVLVCLFYGNSHSDSDFELTHQMMRRLRRHEAKLYKD